MSLSKWRNEGSTGGGQASTPRPAAPEDYCQEGGNEKEKKWVTRGGYKVSVKTMTLAHLHYALAMIHRETHWRREWIPILLNEVGRRMGTFYPEIVKMEDKVNERPILKRKEKIKPKFLTVSELLDELTKMENQGYKNRPVFLVCASDSTSDSPEGNPIVGVRAMQVTKYDVEDGSPLIIQAVALFDGNN